MAPTALKDMTQKIIDVLNTDATLHSTVKTWAFGEPISTVILPLIWVQLEGGPYKWKSVHAMQQVLRYLVVVQDRSSISRDAAEKSCMDLMDLVTAKLKANPTLDNSCRYIGFSDLENRPKKEADYAIAEIQLRILVEREYA